MSEPVKREPVDSTKWFEEISDALTERQEWEKKLANFEAQRHGDDRAEVNDDPFPNASNVRDQVADGIIEKKKAAYSQVIYASENLALFKPLVPANIPFSNNLAPYFDNIIKEHTDWEYENVFALDAGLQDGEGFIKCGWDYENLVPKPKWVENLMIIQPANAAMFHDNPWVVEVIHLSKKKAKKQFSKLPGFPELLKSLDEDQGADEINDEMARQRERYARNGINMSGKSSRIVLWELHYEDDEGNKRLRTMSPDDPKFDFQDDREYPFWMEKRKIDKISGQETVTKNSRWMYEQFRREWTKPDQHSSRGIPEVVEEAEFLATALRRAKHNAMTMTQTPMFESQSGFPTGSTNNIPLVLGGILPVGIRPTQWPAPPYSYDQEIHEIRQMIESRMATPDSGLGSQNNKNNNKTATEADLIGSIMQLTVNYETTPWKKFIRACYRQMWERIVQFKPDSLQFYLNGTIQSLPPEALNGDYMIDVSWSGESLNREALASKAFSLHQEALKLGVPSVVEQTWKNLCENVVPGQVQRFEINPQRAQQDMGERIADELDTMVSIGFPVRVKEDVDHNQAVTMAVQFIQAKQMEGQPISAPAQALIKQYIEGHRAMLAKTNPEQSKQLDQHLAELEQATAQQAQQQALGQPPIQPPQPPNGLPPQI